MPQRMTAFPKFESHIVTGINQRLEHRLIGRRPITE